MTMQILLKEEPELRMLPKRLPVGYKLPRDLFSQFDSRGPPQLWSKGTRLHFQLTAEPDSAVHEVLIFQTRQTKK